MAGVSQIWSEMDAINRVLAGRGVDAGVWRAKSGEGAQVLVLYRLALGDGERINRVEALLGEVSEALSELRGRPTPVRLRRMPLALEVEHPDPAPLAWPGDLGLPPLTMLLGRSWGARGGQWETVRFEDAPHTLIAGMTGAGKSTMLRGMVLSLALATSPAALALVLVDLKNRDIAPLQSLAHSGRRCAVTPDEATAAVGLVHDLVRERIQTQTSAPAVVLVIDELRELCLLPGMVERLSSIVSLARACGIYVLAATQHPVAREIGAVVKANFPLRLVGLVAGAKMAEVAADRPGTYAHLLPGRGAFVKVLGPTLERVQAPLLGMQETIGVLRAVRRKWAGVEGVIEGLGDYAIEAGGRPVAVVTQAPNRPIAQSPNLAALQPIFAQFDDGAGGLRRGWKVATVTALNGGVLPTGTTFQRLGAQADQAAAAWLQRGETAVSEPGEPGEAVRVWM